MATPLDVQYVILASPAISPSLKTHFRFAVISFLFLSLCPGLRLGNVQLGFSDKWSCPSPLLPV